MHQSKMELKENLAKMNIILINTLYYPNFIGGAEKSVQYLAESFVQKGHKITVLTTTYKNDYTNYVNNVLVYYINTQNIYWGVRNQQKSIKKILWHTIDSYNFLITKKIKKILIKEKPDIIHTNNISGFSVNIWSIISQLKFKIVHTLRDYYLLCPKTTMFSNGLNCIKQCYSCKIYSIPKKITSQKVNAIIGTSHYVLQKHLDHGYFLNTSNKEIIGNNVGKISVVKKIFDTNKIVFGFIGQINKSKGIEFLLSTFQKVNINQKWKLLIAGKGDFKYIKQLKKIYESDQIIFLGEVKSENFYNNIDVLIVPSLWQEPFGRVVIEGLKYEKHVLGSNLGGIIDLLPEENLFNPNSDELLYKIRILIKKGKLPLPIDYFDTDVTNKYLELYNKVLAIK